MQNLLEIDSVRKSFNTNVILTDIYLKCETGDVIGMLSAIQNQQTDTYS